MVTSPTIGLDTKTHWLTDRQSQRDSDSDSDSDIGNTPTTKKGIIPHKKIKERKAHNNCLRKTSNNKRRKTKASTAHSSITKRLMD
jgi:hypothetical protein